MLTARPASKEVGWATSSQTTTLGPGCLTARTSGCFKQRRQAARTS